MSTRSKRPGAGFEVYFTERKFWSKVGRNAKAIGKKVLRPAVALYYCWKDDQTPAWAKAYILGALGYLIWPADAVPDFLPVIGYTDDAAVIAAVVVAVGSSLKRRHWKQADEKISEWFK